MGHAADVYANLMRFGPVFPGCRLAHSGKETLTGRFAALAAGVIGHLRLGKGSNNQRLYHLDRFFNRIHNDARTARPFIEEPLLIRSKPPGRRRLRAIFDFDQHGLTAVPHQKIWNPFALPNNPDSGANTA